MSDLKRLRKVLNLTQADMAEKLGITPAYYAHIENGRRKVSLKLAYKLSKIFNLSIEEIFFPQGQSTSYSSVKSKVSAS